jgi:thioredoxin-related protein
MQKLSIVVASAWIAIFSCAQQSQVNSNPRDPVLKQAAKDREKLEWLNLNEAGARLQTLKKPVMIDLYTDWCTWCKVMDKKTYTNSDLIKYVTEKFYPVKLDAETKEILNWKGRQFKFRPDYRVNEFAVYLSGGNLAFPTTIILPADGSAPQAIPGYLKPEEMELVLKYFGEGYFGKTSFGEFQQKFKSTWK